MIVIYTDDDLETNKKNTPFEQVAWADIKEYRLSAAWLADVVIFERGSQRRLLKNRYGSLSDSSEACSVSATDIDNSNSWIN